MLRKRRQPGRTGKDEEELLGGRVNVCGVVLCPASKISSPKVKGTCLPRQLRVIV